MGLNGLFNMGSRDNNFAFNSNFPIGKPTQPIDKSLPPMFESKSKHILGDQYDKILNARVGDYDITKINQNIPLQ